MAGKNRKVQVESGVDATGARKGFTEIKDAAKDMSKAVAQEGQAASKGVEAVGAGGDVAAAKVERATKSMVAQIQRLTAEARAGSKNTGEYFTERAKQLGIDPTALQPYLKDLAAVSRAEKVAQGTLDGMGMSAKATTAALRQVPAQFTDIITSLQGGQKPITVLLQQGGQLKDVFGGVGPAARALGGYVLGLVNPTTLAAAAVGVLAYAWYEGAQENQQFVKTLALSGGQIGKTTEQLQAMARSIRDLGDGTQGRASEVIAALAGDANIAADSLQRYADAAIKLERVGGPAAEQTAKMFSEIGRSPVDAALKYNQALNFLTPAIYSQIKALQEHGKTQEAARVASDALAGATEKEAQQIGQSLGYIERATKATADGFKGMWDALLDIGRPGNAIDEAKKTAGGFIEYLQGLTGLAGALPASALPYVNGAGSIGGADLARKKLAEDDAEAKRKQAIATQALADLDKQADQFLPRRIQMERELAQARENGRKALAAPDLDPGTRARIQQQLALSEKGIREKFDPGITQANAQSGIEGVKRQLGLLTAAYADAEAILQAQRSAGVISEADYYEAKRAFIRLDQEAQVSALNAENARLKEAGKDEKLTTAQRIANGDKIKDNTAKVAEINAKAAASTVVLGIQQKTALDGIAKAYEEAKQAAEDYLTTLQRTQQRDLDLFSASNRTRQTEQGRTQISDRYLQERQRIQNERALTAIQQGGSLTSDQTKRFDDLLALNRDFETKALASYGDYVKRRIDLEGEWSEGAGRAFRNYIDDARDVAKQTEDLFSKAFTGLEDGLLNFVKTGKLNFGSLADSIISDLLRIQIKEALVKSFAYFGFGAGSSTASTGVAGGEALQLSEGFARGGVFDPAGEVKRFAAGDVFDQPMSFSYGGGRRGELGEAGPEAIMPLRRGANGKLGVVAAGGAGDQISNHFYLSAGLTRNDLAAMLPEIERRIEAKVQARQRRPGYAGAN